MWFLQAHPRLNQSEILNGPECPLNDDDAEVLSLEAFAQIHDFF